MLPGKEVGEPEPLGPPETVEGATEGAAEAGAEAVAAEDIVVAGEVAVDADVVLEVVEIVGIILLF